MSDNSTLLKAVDLSLKLIEVLDEASQDYTVSFNALSMSGITLLVPYMQDNDIPLTPENFNAQYERLVANMERAKEFIIHNTSFLSEGAPIEQDQAIPS